jgi:hypothetical protein
VGSLRFSAVCAWYVLCTSVLLVLEARSSWAGGRLSLCAWSETAIRECHFELSTTNSTRGNLSYLKNEEKSRIDFDDQLSRVEAE